MPSILSWAGTEPYRGCSQSMQQIWRETLPYLHQEEERDERLLLLGKHTHPAMSWHRMGWSQPSACFHMWMWVCVEVTPFLGDWQVDVWSMKPAIVFSLFLSTSLQQKEYPNLVWSCCWVVVAWLRDSKCSARWRAWTAMVQLCHV